jgi:hypothetical protein
VGELEGGCEGGWERGFFVGRDGLGWLGSDLVWLILYGVVLFGLK